MCVISTTRKHFCRNNGPARARLAENTTRLRLTVLIRPNYLCREELGIDGDADVALLGVAVAPVLESYRVQLRGMGGKDPGLVCGAPRTFDGECFAQGMNDPRTCRQAVIYSTQQGYGGLSSVYFMASAGRYFVTCTN